jgi:Putative metallopeptidase
MPAAQPFDAMLSEGITVESLRRLPVCATLGMLLMGCGAAAGQSAQSGSPLSRTSAEEAARTFQTRIEDVARALQNEPRLKNLSHQQLIDRVEFVLGNTLFILLHEMGHVHFSEMKLPVLGREEDEADTFAAITMLRVGTSFSERVLATASQGWFFSERRNQQTGAKPLYYDEHDLSSQRAYQIVCLMVGSDPAKFKSLADDAKMPDSRQQSCKRDYAKASRSWDMVLAPYRRAADQPETKINVVYGDAQRNFEVFARSFRAVRMLETVAERSASIYAWPAPFTMEMLSCGGPNANWDDETRTLKVCYQLPFDFAQLYQAYAPTAPPLALANQKQKRKQR